MGTPLRHAARFSFDTPTPASSSHTSSFHHPFTSLKPSRSVQNLKQQQQPFRSSGNNMPQGQPLDTADLNAINLDELEIKTDGTEKERLRLEEEIRVGMQELEFSQQQQQGHRRGASTDSLEFGKASDLEDLDLEMDGKRWRDQLEDEEESVLSREDLHQQQQQQHHHQPSDSSASEEEDLTYLSISRSISLSPTSPRKAAVSQPQTLSTSHAQKNIFSQPQPSSAVRPSLNFISSLKKQQQQQQQPTSAPTAASAAPVSHSHPNAKLRLPDVTGLTEGLTSPAKARGHVNLGGAAGGGTRSAPPGSRSHPNAQKQESKEAQILTSALHTLRDRILELERENRGAEEKIQGLEEKRKEPVMESRGEEAWRKVLKEEERKRSALESLVHRLESQIAHLSHSLSSLTSLPQTQPAAPSSTLVREISSLSASLRELGEQVDVLKGRVDELQREGGWRREEGERGDVLGKGQPAVIQTQTQTQTRREGEGLKRKITPPKNDAAANENGRPTTWKWTGPETPKSGKCFVRPDEINRLQNELEREYSRRSPAPSQASMSHSHSSHDEEEDHDATPRPRRTLTTGRTNREQEFDPDTTSQIADARAKVIFQSVSAPRHHVGHETPKVCSVCRRRKVGVESAPAKPITVATTGTTKRKEKENRRMREQDSDGDDEYEEIIVGGRRQEKEREQSKAQTQTQTQKKEKVDHRKTMEGVLRDLEDDFLAHKK